MTDVVVAVLTYRRAAGLARMLPAVIAQAHALDGWVCSIVVVDNDPSGSAAEVVAGSSGGAVRYAHEPRPGIAAARNRAFAEAGDARLLVFIDDDELPGPGWLPALIGSWERWRCAAVSGPVRPEFGVDPGEWVRLSGAFTRRRAMTGATVSGAPTNNLLVDLDVVRTHGLGFDERYGLTGGEDTRFARSLIDRGGVVRWCDEAEVLEPVAPERATRRWVLRRAFRTGTTWSAIELERSASARRGRTRIGLVVRALYRLVPALARALAGLATRSTERRAPAEVVVAARLGMLMGAGGYVFREYRRPSVATGSRRDAGSNRFLSRRNGRSTKR